MPYTSQLISNGTGLLRVGTGILTGQEIIDAARSAVGAEIHQGRLTHRLVDLTRITAFHISAQDVDTIVDHHAAGARTSPGQHIAIVTAGDLAFGVARMYGTLVERAGFIVHVFKDMNEAKTWLRSQPGVVLVEGEL